MCTRMTLFRWHICPRDTTCMLYCLLLPQKSLDCREYKKFCPRPVDTRLIDKGLAGQVLVCRTCDGPSGHPSEEFPVTLAFACGLFYSSVVGSLSRQSNARHPLSRSILPRHARSGDAWPTISGCARSRGAAILPRIIIWPPTHVVHMRDMLYPMFG